MSLTRATGLPCMLIIAGHLIVHAEDRDRYVADSSNVVEQARNAPGCLDFALTADTLDYARVNIFERWRTDDELTAFRGTGPDDTTAERIVEAAVQKYQISSVESP